MVRGLFTSPVLLEASVVPDWSSLLVLTVLCSDTVKIFVCLAGWVLDELSISEDKHLGLVFGVVGSGNKFALPGPWLSNVVGYSEVLS